MHCPLARDLEGLAAVWLEDQAAETHGVADNPRMAGNRRAARAVEHSEKWPVGSDRDQGINAVDGVDAHAGDGVVVARLDADRALTDRRGKFVDVEHARRR